jgi:pyridoxal phosphate enzyme (YggS family)
MIDVRANCLRIFTRIQQAAARSGRDPASIRLIAVSKTVPPDRIREAVECGIRDLGENRLQEALPKIEALTRMGVQPVWHFIGHLQTNKAKKVVEHFQWVQCVDRIELAQRLNQAAATTLPVLIEVKLQAEPNKSGVEESRLPMLVEAFRDYSNLQLRGLMAIPPYFDDPEEARPYFRKLRDLAQRWGLPELSMGMSHDFEAAIEEGATMVRIGTALFGERR